MERWIATLKSFSVLRQAIAQGLEPAWLREETGLDIETLLGLDSRTSLELHFQVWEVVLRRLRDPLFPLRVATLIRDDLHLFSFLVTTSATVGEALRRGIAYQRLLMNHGGWSSSERGETLVLRWSSWSAEPARRLGERAACEAAVVAMVTGIRSLGGAEARVRSVRMAHPEPPGGLSLKERLGVEASWGGASYELEFPRSVLALPNQAANPALASFLEEQCASQLSREDATRRPVTRQVRELLLRAPSELPLSMRAVARHLALSERSLRRRLQEEGSRFRALQDEVHAEVARRYLADPALSIREVAYLTGFSSHSAFYRAFRRWTGDAPGRAVQGRPRG